MILVTGATGNVGRYLVRQLVEAEQPVRALTRHPDRANLPGRVQVVGGDLTEPESAKPAGMVAAAPPCPSYPQSSTWQRSKRASKRSSPPR